MFYNINMEFIQAFNPLYAVPIVAVIFCALIVFTFGFKSPIQPPSFEGLEDDRKSSKKRKTKETQKQNKLVTNGKVNGIATSKGKAQELPKKKEVVDKNVINEKLRSNEKTAVDKKAAKKAKSQNEKHLEKKKETVVTDELNDDGWVQHVSKKGKKNRKKEDNTESEFQSSLSQSPSKKVIETNDLNEAEKVSNHVEVLTEEKKEIHEEKPLKKLSKKETILEPALEKPVKLDIAEEVKPDENYLECDLKQLSTNIPTVSEDTSKSKKKKKKQGTTSVTVETNSITAPSPQIEPVSNITEASVALPKISEPVALPKISESVALPKISESVALPKISESVALPKISESVNDNVPVRMPDDSKTNVVFDELAGLYPEAKEKKKKKVRRDH